MNQPNQICSRCVMDASIPGISFDSEGKCNYCTEFLQRSSKVLFATDQEREQELSQLVERIKAGGKGKPYDCVVGISGGVDSAWVLHKAIELGLRPLAAHMDNGWNSELAQHNIEQLIRKLGVDLYTHVIDWPEYRKLMQAFFDADVIDIELLYDNAAASVILGQASRHGVQYVLTGANQSTEGMQMPRSWYWFKRDKYNIFAIWRRFGDGTRVKTFPALGLAKHLYYTHARRIRFEPFLDYFEYDKPKALALLTERFGYKPYPYKHYESVFTRFYQGYLLPRKFGVDKRRVHLSSMVISGQMSRAAALADLEHMPYPSQEALDQDTAYFLKKMGWTREQLDGYLARPERGHAIYGSEKPLWELLGGISRRLAGRGA